MANADRQFGKALIGDHAREVLGQQGRRGQLADAVFGGDLHRGGRADCNEIGLVPNGLAGVATQRVITPANHQISAWVLEEAASNP